MVETITLNVQGMSCGHCVKSVEESVSALSGVEKIQVDLENAQVQVVYNNDTLDVAQISETIEEQGYTVVK